MNGSMRCGKCIRLDKILRPNVRALAGALRELCLGLNPPPPAHPTPSRRRGPPTRRRAGAGAGYPAAGRRWATLNQAPSKSKRAPSGAGYHDSIPTRRRGTLFGATRRRVARRRVTKSRTHPTPTWDKPSTYPAPGKLRLRFPAPGRRRVRAPGAWFAGSSTRRLVNLTRRPPLLWASKTGAGWASNGAGWASGWTS
eukprot:gene12911-biopygen3671